MTLFWSKHIDKIWLKLLSSISENVLFQFLFSPGFFGAWNKGQLYPCHPLHSIEDNKQFPASLFTDIRIRSPFFFFYLQISAVHVHVGSSECDVVACKATSSDAHQRYHLWISSSHSFLHLWTDLLPCTFRSIMRFNWRKNLFRGKKNFQTSGNWTEWGLIEGNFLSISNISCNSDISYLS